MLLSTIVAYLIARVQGSQGLRDGLFSALGWLILIAAFLYLLYYAEGSEIAATTVLDRDEDELTLDPSTRGLLETLRRDPNRFVSGRQFIVIILVVAFAALCEDFVSNTPPQPWTGYFSWIFDTRYEHVYWFAFPILMALWISQLHAKFVAQRRPASFLSTDVAHKAIIVPSLWLGKNLMVGRVSEWLTGYSLRGKNDDPRTPSRIKCYEALAAFRDGFGFEKTIVQLEINPNDGSLAVRVTCRVHAYAPGAQLFRQQDLWDAPFLAHPRISVSRKATLEKMEFEDHDKVVKWDFRLTDPLKLGDELDFEAAYEVGPGGVQFGLGSVGEFYYEQHKYPMRHLTVRVRLTDTATYTLNPGTIVPVVSDTPETNEREARRFDGCIVSEDDGLNFDIAYPLMGGTYKCRWTTALRV